MPNPLPEIKLVPLTGGQPARSTPRATVADFRLLKLEEFLRSGGHEPNTRKAYDRQLRQFLAWTDLGWGEIKPRHLAQYREYLAIEHRTPKGTPLSKSSINSAITALKAFYRWFTTAYPELASGNPTTGIRFEKIPLPPAQSLTVDEMARVWEAIAQLGETKERDTALLHLLSHGLRAGEIASLTVRAFDQGEGLLFLADTKTDEPRLVPLRSDAMRAIASYLEQRRATPKPMAGDRPLLLSHHVARQWQGLSYHGIYFVVERWGDLAEIEGLHPHAFRHTYATGLLAMGLDPSHAMILTGHRSDRAFKRYTLASRQQAAIAAFRAIEGRRDAADAQQAET